MPKKRKNPSSKQSLGKKQKNSQQSEESGTKIISTIIDNPGFAHITQKIIGHLDHNSQLKCRLVCKSWKTQMDQPYFWIQKLDQKGQSKEIHDEWVNLLPRIEKGSYLEQEFRQCLMFWYGGKDNWGENYLLDGIKAVHVVVVYGSLSLLELIDSCTENLNVPKNNGWTPTHLAAVNGQTEMFKFMASKVENPNAPTPEPEKWTPKYSLFI